MKKNPRFFIPFVLIIIFLSISINAPTGTAEQNFTYSNDSIGIGFYLPENWEIFKSKENSPELFKDRFTENKSPDDSPLFIGMQLQRTAFIRCLVEKAEYSISDTFKILYNASIDEENFEVLEAKYIEEKKTIFWRFETILNGIKFQFMELMTMVGNNIIRVGFWTPAELYDAHKEQFQTIIRNTRFKKEENWISDWKNIFTLLPDKDIDYITLKEQINTDAKKSKGICYKVKGKKNNVYILGAIHVGKSDMYPFTDAIESAFNESEYLGVEINASNKKTGEELLEAARFGNNKTIKEELSPTLYSRLSEKFTQYGIEIDMFKQYKPWFFASIISLFNLSELGYMADYGVELYFLNRVENKKDIVELESVDEQTKMMDSIDGELFLNYSLLGLESTNEEVEELIKNWKTGNVIGIEKIIFSDKYNSLPKIDTILNKLFYNRNKKMAKKIMTYLKDTDDYFIVVGAGHLIGEKSIITILSKKGYSPEIFY